METQLGQLPLDRTSLQAQSHAAIQQQLNDLKREKAKSEELCAAFATRAITLAQLEDALNHGKSLSTVLAEGRSASVPQLAPAPVQPDPALALADCPSYVEQSEWQDLLLSNKYFDSPQRDVPKGPVYDGALNPCPPGVLVGAPIPPAVFMGRLDRGMRRMKRIWRNRWHTLYDPEYLLQPSERECSGYSDYSEDGWDDEYETYTPKGRAVQNKRKAEGSGGHGATWRGGKRQSFQPRNQDTGGDGGHQPGRRLSWIERAWLDDQHACYRCGGLNGHSSSECLTQRPEAPLETRIQAMPAGWQPTQQQYYQSAGNRGRGRGGRSYTRGNKGRGNYGGRGNGPAPMQEN